jgi:uncharacterized membrane protein YkoI
MDEGVSRALLVVIVAISLAGCGEPPRARQASQPARPAAAPPDLGRIRRIALAEAPGEIVSVELEWREGAEAYEIKVLARSGRIVELRIDAATGAVLQREAE